MRPFQEALPVAREEDTRHGTGTTSQKPPCWLAQNGLLLGFLMDSSRNNGRQLSNSYTASGPSPNRITLTMTSPPVAQNKLLSCSGKVTDELRGFGQDHISFQVQPARQEIIVPLKITVGLCWLA